MSSQDRPQMVGKEKLYGEISEKTGVPVEHVQKVLEVLGIERHFNEAAEHLGATPGLKEVMLGYRISRSTIAV